METTITISDILQAKQRGYQKTEQWQASRIEIILHPAILPLWNTMHPELQVTRVSGLPYYHCTVEDNRRICLANLWDLFGGYTLKGWNSVRPDYYAHSASTCWDGLRRSVNTMWVETIALLPHVSITTRQRHLEDIHNVIAPHKITIPDLDALVIPMEREPHKMRAEATIFLLNALRDHERALKEGGRPLMVAEYRLRVAIARAKFWA